MPKTSLVLQPIHNTYTDIIRRFHLGLPLTSEERHKLSFKLKHSSYLLDQIKRYYRISPQYLLPKKSLTFNAINDLYDYNLELIEHHIKPKQLKLSISHYQDFINNLLMHNLIQWHGNQLLTGAPFFYGGIPHIEFFQWGNLYGVVKYEELWGEKALDANILIYFEDIKDRNIEQFKREYFQKLTNQVKINQLKQTIPPLTKTTVPEAHYYIYNNTPRLSQGR